MSLSAVNEQLPEKFGSFRFPNMTPAGPHSAFWAGQSTEFQDLRAMSMTKNEKGQAAIPHQDIRNLSCRAWLSLPRGVTQHQKLSGFGSITEI